MARLNSRKNWNVYLPNGSREISRVALGFVTLLPSEEARFVLPHVKGVGKNWLVLDPDNLLVNENPTVSHCLLHLHLTLRGMPNVYRSIRFADSKCLA